MAGANFLFSVEAEFNFLCEDLAGSQRHGFAVAVIDPILDLIIFRSVKHGKLVRAALGCSGNFVHIINVTD